MLSARAWSRSSTHARRSGGPRPPRPAAARPGFRSPRSSRSARRPRESLRGNAGRGGGAQRGHADRTRSPRAAPHSPRRRGPPALDRGQPEASRIAGEVRVRLRREISRSPRSPAALIWNPPSVAGTERTPGPRVRPSAWSRNARSTTSMQSRSGSRSNTSARDSTRIDMGGPNPSQPFFEVLDKGPRTSPCPARAPGDRRPRPRGMPGSPRRCLVLPRVGISPSRRSAS